MHEHELANTLKKLARGTVEQQKPTDVFIAVVEKASPLTIRISDKFTLDSSFLHICAGALPLAKNDTVALLRAAGGQTWVVLDKVVIP